MTAQSTIDDRRTMGGETQAIDRSAADSLIGWWLDSGVDMAVGETPRDWLRRGAAPVPARPAAAAKPERLDEFQHWLSSAPGLPLDRPGAVRIGPQGQQGAKVMLLADLPGPNAAADGRAIGGDAWVLAQKMLAAIGVSTKQSYIASLACFHLPGARIGREELEACAAIARDHVRLAAPERLILLGDEPSRALLGEPVARTRGKIHRVERVRTIATFHPRWLLQRPSDKALAWRDLLLLMSGSD
ncbi:MAG TPA: uracil-DNA glycosylase family protein [Sphingomicrobium sp.]|nr:uracil-DNA glycosylase family protein [Sphingomicrobium sp.]